MRPRSPAQVWHQGGWGQCGTPRPDPPGPEGAEEDKGAPHSAKLPALIYRREFCSQCCNYRRWKSQNHRLVWAGRDLRAHPAHPPAPGRDPFPQPRVLPAPSNLALSRAGEGAVAAPPGSPLRKEKPSLRVPRCPPSRWVLGVNHSPSGSDRGSHRQHVPPLPGADPQRRPSPPHAGDGPGVPGGAAVPGCCRTTLCW